MKIPLSFCVSTWRAIPAALVLSLSLSLLALAPAQTIPPSGAVLAVVEVATIPDSSPNTPPRVNLVTEDPSGRLFANDQRGPLYTFNEDTGAVTLYLDLDDEVTYPDLDLKSTSEAGFQSFAFHPQFFEESAAGFGRFYTIHTSTNTSPTPDFVANGSSIDSHTLLLEWRTNTPAADTFSPADAGNPYRELMRLRQPYGNHNAGLIAFNPVATPGHDDFGNLYIAIGDGGDGGDPDKNALDTGNPFGAILRIDPLGSNSANGQYGIVADNVLAADSNPATLGEIYAWGLRNPQRFSWDIVTGNAYLADIGQNAVEEINQLVNGGNYGWDAEEGSGGAPTYLDPIAEYFHGTNPVDPMPTSIGSRAVTCGDAIRGACIPALEGQLITADFPTGLIFLVDLVNGDLDGGIDEFTELLLQDDNGDPTRYIDLMNAARADRSLSSRSRADLRFSINTPGRIFLMNKGDGIIRRISPTTEPEISFTEPAPNQLEIQFTGLFKATGDLGEEFSLVLPQPTSPATIDTTPGATTPDQQFYRAILP